MKQKSFILHYSLFAGLIGLGATPAADAAIRIGNASRNYAAAYQQVAAQQDYMNAAQQAPATDTTTAELPVRVANTDVAAQVTRGDANAPVTMTQLDRCSKIYPDGEFAWDRPTVGPGADGAATCVAVVEMRGYQMGPNGSDVVLARANLAAGQAVKCNISEFPEDSYTAAAGNITFPADKEPTTDDVVRVMNEEQKQNAGLKIAASAVVGALGGNLVGKNEPGKDGLLGTGKHKMQSSLVGALGGAAIGAGGAYAGKVGGDIIMSTGVNAAAGGIIGNMAGVGNSVLRIEECKTPDNKKESCLWGLLVMGTEKTELTNGTQHAYFNIIDGKTIMLCDQDNKNCHEDDLVSIEIDGKSLESCKETDFQAMRTNNDGTKVYHLEQEENSQSMKPGGTTDNQALYTPITKAKKPTQKITAAIVGVHDKAFGMKRNDWIKWKRDHASRDASQIIYGRRSNGELYKLENVGTYTLDDFDPITLDASDGGLIDFNNKARTKATLVGAGAGGALGAFSAYQGAQNDIDNRWVSAVHEYKTSLEKVYCITGRRFLSFYNSTAEIPEMKE